MLERYKKLLINKQYEEFSREVIEDKNLHTYKDDKKRDILQIVSVLPNAEKLISAILQNKKCGGHLLKQSGEDVFCKAVMAGRIDIVRLLLKHGIKADAMNAFGETALMLAIKFAHLELVKLLIENGANINAVSHAETPVLFMALIDCDIMFV